VGEAVGVTVGVSVGVPVGESDGAGDVVGVFEGLGLFVGDVEGVGTGTTGDEAGTEPDAEFVVGTNVPMTGSWVTGSSLVPAG